MIALPLAGCVSGAANRQPSNVELFERLLYVGTDASCFPASRPGGHALPSSERMRENFRTRYQRIRDALAREEGQRIIEMEAFIWDEDAHAHRVGPCDRRAAEAARRRYRRILVELERRLGLTGR